MASDSDAGGERRIALSEREVEVAEIGRALERASTGGTLVIEGPAGIGKTSLMNELEEQARGGGFRLLRATGSELERDFGFGIVRQLLGPMLRSTDDAGSALLLSGPAALAAPVFGIGEAGALEVHSGEASLYGLFWLLAGLADEMPVVLAIDDAHWADAASLRFIRYLCQRLPGMPVLVTLATRPSEPGAQAEILKDLTNALEMPTIRPSLLSQAGTAGVVRAGLGEASAPTEAAFYEATGGNPLLIAELLAELRLSGSGAPVPEQVAAMGPKRIAWSVIERARALDPDAGDLVRAAALLGGGWDTRIVAELAGIEAERAARMIDGLSAASILVADSRLAFVHPLLRTAVYEDIPAAERAGAHSRAAELLARQGAGAEEVAAHLLSSAPGGTNGALQTLDEAAANALARGATESVVAYLRRALGEEMEQTRRADLLHRLGSAEVTLRDPASIGHLQAAIELAGEPRRALSATLELAGVLSTAGMWEETGRAIETGLAEFGGSDLSGVLELEAFRAAYLGYDPASAEKYAEDVPRLLGLVEGRTDFDSSSLRCVLGTIGAFQETSREAITELISPDSLDWRLARDGRESTLVPVAILALLMVDALEEAESAVAVVIEDARARGSLLAMISGVGATAVVNQRRGRLAAAEADLRTAIELLGENELSLMALATFLHFCLETIAEREELNELATVVEALEMPPAFGKTFSGAGGPGGPRRHADGTRRARGRPLRSAERRDDLPAVAHGPPRQLLAIAPCTRPPPGVASGSALSRQRGTRIGASARVSASRERQPSRACHPHRRRRGARAASRVSGGRDR